jgi:thioredoxin-like negative regulator of GroEL
LLLAAACASPPVRLAPPVHSQADRVAQPATTQQSSIRFVENDYPRALAEAKERKLPLFVDAWAPWCHSCLSLRNYVFPDPALKRLGEHFVWLSVDTEREENAPIVSKLAVRVLPTLYVVESANESPVLAWSGSLTADELAELLEGAELSAHRTEGGAAAVAFVQGQRASAGGRLQDAVRAYREALAMAPPSWPKRAQAVDALVAALADEKRFAECATTGADAAPTLPPGTALADVLRAAIGCAQELSPSSPARGRLSELAAFGERVTSDAAVPILADDRSDLFDYVVGALRELGRDADVNRVAQAWSTFLDEQAARAPTRAARAVFDAHRVRAYAAIGQPERALPMLSQSERDFPADYNPPARMAAVYLGAKRYEEALDALKRALGRAYGPRKLQIFALEADVYEAKDDRASALGALQTALDYARVVPLTARYAELREALARRWAHIR